MLCGCFQIYHYALRQYQMLSTACCALSVFGKYTFAFIQWWSRVFLPSAFLHHDFTGALSSVSGWFPGRCLTLPLCAPSRPVLSFQRKQRKGFSERYTPAFPATSQVHLKMRSDDTQASSAPLACSLLLSFLFLPGALSTFISTVACFERGKLL